MTQVVAASATSPTPRRGRDLNSKPKIQAVVLNPHKNTLFLRGRQAGRGSPGDPEVSILEVLLPASHCHRDSRPNRQPLAGRGKNRGSPGVLAGLLAEGHGLGCLHMGPPVLLMHPSQRGWVPFCAGPVNSGQVQGLAGLGSVVGPPVLPVPSGQAMPHFLPTEGPGGVCRWDQTVCSSDQMAGGRRPGGPGPTS